MSSEIKYFPNDISLTSLNQKNLGNLNIPLNSNGSLPQELYLGKNSIGNLSINKKKSGGSENNAIYTPSIQMKINPKKIINLKKESSNISLKDLLKERQNIKKTTFKSYKPKTFNSYPPIVPL